MKIIFEISKTDAFKFIFEIKFIFVFSNYSIEKYQNYFSDYSYILITLKRIKTTGTKLAKTNT